MSRKYTLITASALFSLIFLIATQSWSVPVLINFQGKLTDANGATIDSSALPMKLRIYDGATDGNLLWEESQTVDVQDGVYNVLLGSGTKTGGTSDFGPSLFSSDNCYLEVVVHNEVLRPRQQITSVAFAFHADTADYALTAGDAQTLDGLDATDFVTPTGGDIEGSSPSSILSVTNTGSGYGITGSSAGANGRGVYGIAMDTGEEKKYGGWFEAQGIQGRGVYGIASDTGGTTEKRNYGGFFIAYGTYGRGAFGQAQGSSGIGVKGWASNAGDVQNYGGHFTAGGSTGIGVYGWAENTGDVENYGGYFVADGKDGKGAYGENSQNGNFGYLGGKEHGVHGEASTLTGRAVYAKATGNSGRAVEAVATGSSSMGVFGAGGQYDFYAGGVGTNYGPFTGGHEVKLSNTFPVYIEPGMIVCFTGETQARKDEDNVTSISSTMPTVELSDTENDKAVLGVLVAESRLPKDHWYQPKSGERFGIVNALGEGRVWVSNISGGIQAGDYITTSSIPGYGQKQDDDLLHSYTLGKVTETVDWDSVIDTLQWNGQNYKIYLIAVVYTSG